MECHVFRCGILDRYVLPRGRRFPFAGRVVLKHALVRVDRVEEGCRGAVRLGHRCSMSSRSKCRTYPRRSVSFHIHDVESPTAGTRSASRRRRRKCVDADSKALGELYRAGIDEKQQCASAFRDNVEELMSGASAQQNGVIESLTRVLETVPPQHEANAEHKLRKSILEVINRVPHTEVLKEHVSKLAGALLNVATEDNQENAIVAVKVVLDLLRAFKPPLAEVASPLLHLFTQVR